MTTNSFRYLCSGRFWLAGPITLINAVLIMAAMSLWLPVGNAGIDNLIIPLVLFPLIWSAVFFYVLLENDLKRLYTVMFLLLGVNGGLVCAAIMGWLK